MTRQAPAHNGFLVGSRPTDPGNTGSSAGTFRKWAFDAEFQYGLHWPFGLLRISRPSVVKSACLSCRRARSVFPSSSRATRSIEPQTKNGLLPPSLFELR